MKKRTQRKLANAKPSGSKQEDPSAGHEADAAPEQALTYFKIGDTIRKYRKERNLKLQDLAAMIDMSSSMLSKVENGRMIPTIPTLFAIIQKLGVSVESFFFELKEKDQFPGYIFIPQANYVPYVKEEDASGFDYYSILEHRIESGSFQISLLHVSPRSRRPAVVTSAFEYIYLVSGNIKYSLDDRVFEMQTGDSLFFDGNIPHVPVNESKTMAIMLVVYFFSDEGGSKNRTA